MAESPTHPRPLTVALEGVPETLLWTLYHRAAEAARPDAVLRDPMALGVMSAISFPFEERFGKATSAWSQWQALRALAFDREITRYLAAAPDATVVALGEGLETQFWRVDNGRLRWLSIDLPEAIERARAAAAGGAAPADGGDLGARRRPGSTRSNATPGCS